MTTRPRSPKARRTKRPKNGRHRTGVLLEDVYGQMQVVLERLGDTATRGEIRDVATRIEDLGGRMGLVEDVLRRTRRELGETRRELGETRKELGETRQELGGRIDGVDGRLAGLEHEVRGLRQDVARQGLGAELRALDERMTKVERHLGV